MQGLRRVPRVLWAGILGFLIALAGSLVLGTLLTVNLRTSPDVPWWVLPMAGYLWLLWRYLGGSGWPRSTSESRRRSRRANRVSGRVFGWALLAGVLAIAALAGYWVALSQLVKMAPNPFSDYSRYSVPMAVAVVVMGSINSPITEEAGFRGYCQTRLEREFPAFAAVALSSVFFMLFHLNQGLEWPKLLVFYLVGVTFGAIAYLANSILASIPVHMLGDLTFFIFIWPRDAARRLIWETGADDWFWTHVAQAIVFTGLAILAFRRLARVTRGVRAFTDSRVSGLQVNS